MQRLWGILSIGLALHLSATDTWSLDQAWEYAQANSPLLHSSSYEVMIAKAQIATTQSAYRPRVQVGANLHKIDSDRAASTMGLYPEYEGSFSIRAEQRLFSLQSDMQLDIAEIRSAIAILNEDSRSRDLAYQIGTAFVTVAYEKVVRDIYASKRARVQEYLGLSKAKYDAGAIDIGDTLRWESELADISAKLTQAETRINLAKSALKNYLGMPQDAPISIVLDEESIKKFTRLPSGSSSEAMPNPDIAAIQKSIEIAEKQKNQLEESRYTPEVSLYGEGMSVVYKEGEGTDVQTERDRNSYELGVEIGLALYEGGYKRLESERQRLLQFKAQSDIRQLESHLDELRAKALKSLENNQKAYRLSRESAQKAEAFLSNRNKQYQEGTIDITPILDAEEYATISHLNEEQNRFVLMQNRIDLSYALDRLPPK